MIQRGPGLSSPKDDLLALGITSAAAADEKISLNHVAAYWRFCCSAVPGPGDCRLTAALYSLPASLINLPLHQG